MEFAATVRCRCRRPIINPLNLLLLSSPFAPWHSHPILASPSCSSSLIHEKCRKEAVPPAAWISTAAICGPRLRGLNKLTCERDSMTHSQIEFPRQAGENVCVCECAENCEACAWIEIEKGTQILC